MDSIREPATVDRFTRLQQDFVGRVEMIVDMVDSLGLVIYIIITFVRSLVA